VNLEREREGDPSSALVATSETNGAVSGSQFGFDCRAERKKRNGWLREASKHTDTDKKNFLLSFTPATLVYAPEACVECVTDDV